MAWEGNPRTTTPQWRTTRIRILQRDYYRCHVCHQPGADQVDHIVSLQAGGTDTDDNLAAIHDNPCHRTKSAREGASARWATRATRTPEQHPGLT
jgi:5-methylcytosine-specific restriction endonuclease McrA